MLEERLPFSETIAALPSLSAAKAALSGRDIYTDKKLVVLDDDPTGVQTVHDVCVYTDWSRETLTEGFRAADRMFFVLTNSRGLTAEESRIQHEQIAQGIAFAAAETGKDFTLISRSDSTLRGHYPLETETLRRVLEAETGESFDGEIICPFFAEGGRYTINNIHYVRELDELVPAGQTEFAADKTFGYRASSLPEWCEEKTGGRCRAEDVLCVSIDELRAPDIDGVAEKLMGVHDFGKVILNAADYTDVEVFAAALKMAQARGKRFMFRSAAAVPRVLGGVSERALLTGEELVSPGGRGGLVIAGSHVNKTTRQLAALRDCPGLAFICFDQHTALKERGLERESARVSELAEEAVKNGVTAVVYTRRDRLDLSDAGPEKQLEIALRISDALTSVVASLREKPAFILAKGGITSSDVGTKALRVRKAVVMGQVLPGVPVWRTGPESRFPGMPYIIFPGNVGGDDSLYRIVSMLERTRREKE